MQLQGTSYHNNKKTSHSVLVNHGKTFQTFSRTYKQFKDFPGQKKKIQDFSRMWQPWKTFWWRNCLHWKKLKNLETSWGPCFSQDETVLVQGETFWFCNFHLFLCNFVKYIDLSSSAVRFHLILSMILSIMSRFYSFFVTRSIKKNQTSVYWYDTQKQCSH